MADDKKKGASALYDNSPTMKKREKESAATAEADMEAGDKPKADTKAADKGMDKLESASEKFLKAIKEVRSRHESERKDFHGNMRESLRQMALRHDKEIGGLIEQHSPREGNANEADGGTSMPGGAAVVDGMEG